MGGGAELFFKNFSRGEGVYFRLGTIVITFVGSVFTTYGYIPSGNAPVTPPVPPSGFDLFDLKYSVIDY